MSPMMSVIAGVVMVFLTMALASEWAARRLVSRIQERIAAPVRDRPTGD